MEELVENHVAEEEDNAEDEKDGVGAHQLLPLGHHFVVQADHLFFEVAY